MSGYPGADALIQAGVRLDVDGAVVTVTLGRPDVRNAQTPAMWRMLAAIGAALTADVRVVVLHAEGPSFSAGVDRRLLTPDGIPGEPTLASIAGMPDDEADAVIAGFQLALACDLRVLADDARFCMREPSLGLVPDLGGTRPRRDRGGPGSGAHGGAEQRAAERAAQRIRLRAIVEREAFPTQLRSERR